MDRPRPSLTRALRGSELRVIWREEYAGSLRILQVRQLSIMSSPYGESTTPPFGRAEDSGWLAGRLPAIRWGPSARAKPLARPM